jgi:protein subunit release factor B
VKADYQIPVCVTCYGIICTCQEQQPKRFVTVLEWAKIHGISLEEFEQAEAALTKIKEQLIKLDSEYAKEFAE